ncbi:MAG TPA: MFS transporter [Trebonia sp.]|nr:MFS transporter [Trebonia sp.]
MTARAPARPAPSPSRPRPVPGRWLALAVLCVTLLMVALDNTVLNVALPTLVRDLHASTTQLQWVVDAYVLVFAGLLLVSGSVADRVGRKKVFCAGLLAFAAGSAWAAFSGSTGMLIAARASMGIGGATMMPATLSLVTSIFTDPAERQRAIGLWAGTSGLGIALGPIVGGLLLARFWWGSVFLVNVPIAVLGFALAIWLVPDSRNPASRKPDGVGAAASIAGLGLLLWSLIEAPVRGWGSVRVLAALAGGIAVLALFAWWERRTAHPMLPLSFFSRRAFSGAVASVALTMFGLFGALFLLTQYLQFGLGYSALATGVRVLPAAGAIAVIAPLSSLLLRGTAPRYVTGAGLAAIAAGLWQISGATVTSTYGDILPGMILLGIGAGLAIPAATGSVMGSLPGGDAGVGSAANGAFLQTGGALGVAVMGSLLSTRYTSDVNAALAPYHVPPTIAAMIRGSLGGAEQVASRAGGQLGTELTRLAQGAFVSGMDLALAVAAPVALCGCLLALTVLPPRHQRD